RLLPWVRHDCDCCIKTGAPLGRSGTERENLDRFCNPAATRNSTKRHQCHTCEDYKPSDAYKLRYTAMHSLNLQRAGQAGNYLLEHILLESIGARRGGGLFAWTNTNGIRALIQDEVFSE